jgi:myosin heavy subunit
LHEEGDKLILQPLGDDESEPLEIKKSEARIVHPTVLQKMGNLLDLGEFDEGSLLHVIRSRFFDRKIYTNIGTPILIAVNPYQ